jgi:hypothetical protein
MQKTIVATALAAAVGTGIYTLHRSSALTARIQALQEQQAPLTARVQQLEQENLQASNRVAALREENARLKAGVNQNELLKLRGEVGTLRQKSAANANSSGTPATGLAKLLNDPAMKDYMRLAMRDKLKDMYGDFIKAENLSAEQIDQFLDVLGNSATGELSRLTAKVQGNANASEPAPAQDTAGRLRELLGDAGCARFKNFSDEMPARATLTLLNEQLGSASLSADQAARLIQVIKAEPAELTRGVLGSPDKAFTGSQAEIEAFLQRVAESNQRVLQQAGSLLSPDQLNALDGVLTKAIETRKLQGAAFFPKR